MAETLQRSNAAKNVLAAFVNGVAGLLFAVVADVDWAIVGLIGLGSVVGGLLGASVGRRLPPNALRVVIVLVGVAALTVFLVRVSADLEDPGAAGELVVPALTSHGSLLMSTAIMITAASSPRPPTIGRRSAR